MPVQDLPDFPALQQIARALWKVGRARGAAILVGSGFSRNAMPIHDQSVPLPQWNDLADAMARRINADQATKSNPLRLAEEFKAVLGIPALESLIREMVRDDEWLPGELHKKLVRLPWSDILTTNWDTLIERAAAETLEWRYETVHTASDIATTRAPRVVKLHGSFPASRPFIISEEDYRTYPTKFAAFVNLVQQVFLENELCLLGFSGDDPNFLEWSGWIRDQLGASARRIHLVGALRLSIARRKLLESRNISIVDFSPMLKDVDPSEREKTACQLFIDYLLESRPPSAWNWQLAQLRIDHSKTTDQKVEQLLSLAQSWQSERTSYPGWLVCPPQKRAELSRTMIHALHLMKSSLGQLPIKDHGRCVYEAVWRIDRAFSPMPPWIRDLVQSTVDSAERWTDQKQRSFVGLALLRAAREERDKAVFDARRSALEQYSNSDPDTTRAIVYEECLWARDGLDFTELASLVRRIDTADPTWAIRASALHCELGDIEAARILLERAVVELRRRLYRDRDSIWILSRLAWAHFARRAVRSWETSEEDELTKEWNELSGRLYESGVDPWDTLHEFDRKLDEHIRRAEERKITKEIRFDAGTYRDHSSSIALGSWWQEEPIYEISRLCDVTGVLARVNHFLVLAPQMERAESLVGYEYKDDSDYLRLLRITQTGAEGLIEKGFGRIQVARLSRERVHWLYTTLKRALDYAVVRLGRRKELGDNSWITRAASYVEILSRISVRLAEDEAKHLFRDALALARDQRWRSLELFEPLGHLLERSLSAIRPNNRNELLNEILEFPLPGELGMPDHLREWPESAQWLGGFRVSRPNPDTRFANRVLQLTDFTRDSKGQDRMRAAQRLTELYLAEALTTAEGDRLGEALWTKRASDVDLPADTNLYSHLFLLLPSPDKEKARTIFLSRNHEQTEGEFLGALAGASPRKKNGEPASILGAEKAAKIFDSILNWEERPERPLDLGQTRREDEFYKRSVGPALADAILPALNQTALDESTVDRIFALQKEQVPSVVQALPELLRRSPAALERATSTILQSMVSSDSDSSWAGFNALYRWIPMAKHDVSPAIPRRLIEALVAVIEVRREPALLHALNVASRLIDAGMLTAEDKARIASALEVLLTETSYEAQGAGTSTTFTLKRAAAVKLAYRLRTDEGAPGVVKWLETAKDDPLPEVRFAIDDSEY